MTKLYRWIITEVERQVHFYLWKFYKNGTINQAFQNLSSKKATIINLRFNLQSKGRI